MIAAIVILSIVLIAEWSLRPRLDYTRDGKWILWYGKRVRKYKVLNPD